jgi:4-hydroxy-4-methyl-2-oxoglutarate aldolase
MSADFIEILSRAETGAITDAMRLAGTGSWMSGIFPVNPEFRVCGRAFTVLYEHTMPEQKALNIFHLFDLASPGDVVVMDADTDGAVVGENMMQFMANKNLNGMILDGLTRDAGVINKMDIPHFSKGRAIGIYSPAFKPVAYNVPVQCGGVAVEPGDYIIGDIDGVIVLKPNIVKSVIYQLEKVADIEAKMEEALMRNCSVEEICALSAEKKVVRK